MCDKNEKHEYEFVQCNQCGSVYHSNTNICGEYDIRLNEWCGGQLYPYHPPEKKEEEEG